MRLMLAFALACAGVLPSTAQPEAKAFSITAVESRCPEYGTLLKSYALVTDHYVIRFCDLENWGCRLDAGQQTVTFQSPDALTFITLKLVEKNPSQTNQVSQTNLTAGAVSEAAKRVQQIAPGANIKLENDCFSAGVKGQSVDFDYQTNRGQTQGRLAWLDFPTCDLVVSANTLADFKQAHVAFTRFLNSLQLEKIPAKPPGT